MFNSSCYSVRGSRFESQHPHGGSQPLVSQAFRDPHLLLASEGFYIYMVHIYKLTHMNIARKIADMCN